MLLRKREEASLLQGRTAPRRPSGVQLTSRCASDAVYAERVTIRKNADKAIS